MSLLQTIKTDALRARKDRDLVKTICLTTLVGELETAAKNTGHLPTDQEVVAAIKKTLKALDETLRALKSPTDARAVSAQTEKVLLEAYLPTQLTEAQLTELIDAAIVNGASSSGEVMKLLKASHGGQYDGGVAAAIVKARLSK